MTETIYNTHHSHYSIRLAQSNAVEPCIDPAMAAWDLLSNFENWPSWFPNLQKVVRLDPGDPGRGSVLSLDYGNRSEQWTIQYWKPLARIVQRYSPEGQLGPKRIPHRGLRRWLLVVPPNVFSHQGRKSRSSQRQPL